MSLKLTRLETLSQGPGWARQRLSLLLMLQSTLLAPFIVEGPKLTDQCGKVLLHDLERKQQYYFCIKIIVAI